MAQAWQTLEEAALTLGISSRTLHRRLARGEFETRMENGRREVLVVVEAPDPSLARLAAAGRRGAMAGGVNPASAAPCNTSDMADTALTPADEPAYASDDYGSTTEPASDEVQQTMLALHEDRLRRTDLAIMAYQQSVNVAAADARRAITRSRVAWGIAGMATVAAFLGATWATHRVTKVSAEVGHLSASVRQLTDTLDDKSREVQELRQDSQAAKVAAARAEGELAAAKRQVDQLLESQQAAAAQAHLSAYSAPAELSGSSATQPSAIATTQPALAATAITPPPPVSVQNATAPFSSAVPVSGASAMSAASVNDVSATQPSIISRPLNP